MVKKENYSIQKHTVRLAWSTKKGRNTDVLAATGAPSSVTLNSVHREHFLKSPCLQLDGGAVLLRHLVKIRLTAPNARTVQRAQASLTCPKTFLNGIRERAHLVHTGGGGCKSMHLRDIVLEIYCRRTKKKHHDLYATLLRSRSPYN